MKYLATTLMAAAVLFGACLSQAAEPKPIAALAVASYNDLIGDVNFVGALADQPNFGAAADGVIALATQFKGLAGIDKTRPFGAIIQAAGEGENVGGDIAGYVCVPITNFKQALGLLKLFNNVESEDGVYKLTPKDGGKTTYVKAARQVGLPLRQGRIAGARRCRPAQGARRSGEELHRLRTNLPGQRA